MLQVAPPEEGRGMQKPLDTGGSVPALKGSLFPGIAANQHPLQRDAFRLHEGEHTVQEKGSCKRGGGRGIEKSRAELFLQL